MFVKKAGPPLVTLCIEFSFCSYKKLPRYKV